MSRVGKGNEGEGREDPWGPQFWLSLCCPLFRSHWKFETVPLCKVFKFWVMLAQNTKFWPYCGNAEVFASFCLLGWYQKARNHVNLTSHAIQRAELKNCTKDWKSGTIAKSQGIDRECLRESFGPTAKMLKSIEIFCQCHEDTKMPKFTLIQQGWAALWPKNDEIGPTTKTKKLAPIACLCPGESKILWIFRNGHFCQKLLKFPRGELFETPCMSNFCLRH